MTELPTKLIAYLERIRQHYIDTGFDPELLGDNRINIENKTYRLRSWEDYHGTDKLVLFQLKQDSILAVDHVCVGLKVLNDFEAELLTIDSVKNLGY